MVTGTAPPRCTPEQNPMAELRIAPDAEQAPRRHRARACCVSRSCAILFGSSTHDTAPLTILCDHLATRTTHGIGHWLTGDQGMGSQARTDEITPHVSPLQRRTLTPHAHAAR